MGVYFVCCLCCVCVFVFLFCGGLNSFMLLFLCACSCCSCKLRWCFCLIVLCVVLHVVAARAFLVIACCFYRGCCAVAVFVGVSCVAVVWGPCVFTAFCCYGYVCVFLWVFRLRCFVFVVFALVFCCGCVLLLLV